MEYVITEPCLLDNDVTCGSVKKDLLENVKTSVLSTTDSIHGILIGIPTPVTKYITFLAHRKDYNH